MTRRKLERIEAAAAEWLVKKEFDTWQPGERAEFEVWIGDNLAHRIAFIRLEAAWNSSAVLKALRMTGYPDSVEIVPLLLQSLASIH